MSLPGTPRSNLSVPRPTPFINPSGPAQYSSLDASAAKRRGNPASYHQQQPSQQRYGGGASDYRSGSIDSVDRMEWGDLQRRVEDLEAERDELLAENTQLRDVEEQFWLLLTEREDLQKELDGIRAGLGAKRDTENAADAGEPYSPSRGISHNPNADRKMRIEYERMTQALQECMSLLVDREVQNRNEQIKKHGLVSSFLSWVDLGHERGLAMDSVHGISGGSPHNVEPAGRGRSPQMTSPGGAGGAQQPLGAGMFGSAERESLVNQLTEARAALKNVQEELDRTDMSRMQALEDAERLQQQMEMMVTNLQELRNAYAALKAQAERSSETAKEVPNLRLHLSERDQEVKQLKATVDELRRLSDIGSSQLAADAARIRREIAARSQSRTPSASPVAAAAGGMSPPTPRAAADE